MDANALIKESRAFALNVLGKGQQATAPGDLRRAVPVGQHRRACARAKELGPNVFYGG